MLMKIHTALERNEAAIFMVYSTATNRVVGAQTLQTKVNDEGLLAITNMMTCCIFMRRMVVYDE